MKTLRTVPRDQVKDRSAPTTNDSTSVDEELIRSNFFNSGMANWYPDLKECTFSSTFCDLYPEEARVIVEHWRQQKISVEKSVVVTQEAIARLGDLVNRLDEAVQTEILKSSEKQAVVKLSTRSPKDSKRILERASKAYRKRVSELRSDEVHYNLLWRILTEEVTRASAVNSGLDALDLLLDSSRVFEDLEYALDEQPTLRDPASECPATTLSWNACFVARAWDSRIGPETEFRGICWDGKLTCLGQYFHPLFFPEIVEQKKEIEDDVLACIRSANVKAAIDRLGGKCIIDFGRVGPGQVLVVELNPFDGVALGTFPASTGLFLWDNVKDRQVMTGDAPFEFRVREQPLDETELKFVMSKDWRAIVYPSSK